MANLLWGQVYYKKRLCWCAATGAGAADVLYLRYKLSERGTASHRLHPVVTARAIYQPVWPAAILRQPGC